MRAGRPYITLARPVRAFGVEALMNGSTRSSDGLDLRRRKLLFRSWHRGMREMDLVMGRFADMEIGRLSEAELDEYERLVELPVPGDGDDRAEDLLTGHLHRRRHIGQDGRLDHGPAPGR